MATPTRRCLILTTLTSIQILLLWGGINHHQVYAIARDCQPIDGAAILIGCTASLEKDKPKAAPTPLCCEALRSVGMPCVCKAITKDMEQLYSMEKLVYVAAFCGDPLKPGTQCGSYKVPPFSKENAAKSKV